MFILGKYYNFQLFIYLFPIHVHGPVLWWCCCCHATLRSHPSIYLVNIHPFSLPFPPPPRTRMRSATVFVARKIDRSKGGRSVRGKGPHIIIIDTSFQRLVDVITHSFDNTPAHLLLTTHTWVGLGAVEGTRHPRRRRRATAKDLFTRAVVLGKVANYGGEIN